MSRKYLKNALKGNIAKHNSSDLKVLYKIGISRIGERYDFEKEWNNLGYGKITTNGDKFSLGEPELDRNKFSEVLAVVETLDGTDLGVYAGIIEEGGKATLWFNRGVGPVDGVDIVVEEDFLSSYKIENYGSVPVLSEIPWGFDGATTMRIDCDENIASGRDLFEVYKENNIPFSMAIKTDQSFDTEAKNLCSDVMKNGGAIVGHSHTHAPNWGGSKERATWEALKAKERLRELVPKNYTFDYVVSPFHQNPRYAVEGLRDAGIKGFVGGIICNDPEYLVGRAGEAVNVPGIMTHSQQCMLHGDCYHNAGNSIDIYKESFTNHLKSRTFFGFLDHPFSDYQYGWLTEKERCDVHQEFLTFIKSHKKIWHANLIEAMNFLWVKSYTKVNVINGKLIIEIPKHEFEIPDFCVLWNNKKVRVSSKSSSVQKESRNTSNHIY